MWSGLVPTDGVVEMTDGQTLLDIPEPTQASAMGKPAACPLRTSDKR